MAIATATAIGLGLAGVGSFLGAKSQNKAAKTAANTEQAVANQNNALTREIFGQNQQMLNPYVQRGNAAGDTLNAMLGIGGAPQAPQAPQVQNYYSGPNPSAPPAGMSWQDAQGYNAQNPAGFRNAMLDGYPADYGMPQQGIAPQQPAQTVQGNPQDAFRQYLQNSDYGFQFGEGANRVNSGYAGAGTLQSGAAMKDLERFRQDLQSGYRGEFTNLLGNQQGVGLAGASALAGVGQNFVNTISANNQNAGDAAANAALMRGNNNPFANTLGLLGGGLFGMSR